MAADFSEPMSLGSPAGSHGTGFSTHQTPHGCQYLPGFLMGDLSLNTPPSHMNRPVAMLGGHTNQSGSPVPSARTPKSVQRTFLPKPAPPIGSEAAPKEKVGAPPVSTLLDDSSFLERRHAHLLKDLSRSDPPVHSSRFIADDRSPPKYGMAGRVTKQPPQSPPSPAQIDPFFTQGDSIRADVQLDDTWVTVFGFLPSSASFILQRFAQYGTILSHHVSPQNGNWMHIHYESSLQAKKALSRNGKVMLDNVMVGVVPCIDVKLMASCDEPGTAPGASVHDAGASDTPVKPSYPHTIRSLTSAYNSSVSDRQVVEQSLTPQKSNGLLTKAMDYLFG